MRLLGFLSVDELDCLLGNRLIMMHEGHVIYDVAGDEKKSLTVADLLQKFEEVSGGELANDRMLLS